MIGHTSTTTCHGYKLTLLEKEHTSTALAVHAQCDGSRLKHIVQLHNKYMTN